MSLHKVKKDIISADDVEIGKLGPFLIMDVKGPIASAGDDDLELDVHVRIGFTQRGALLLLASLAEGLAIMREMETDE